MTLTKKIRSERNKQKYIDRVNAWEQVLKTDVNGLQYLAKRVIKILKQDINKLWPGCLEEDAKQKT